MGNRHLVFFSNESFPIIYYFEIINITLRLDVFVAESLQGEILIPSRTLTLS